MALALLGACRNQQAQSPNRTNFTAAVNDYLAQRGHLCLGKYNWPITVTTADWQARSLDARQMPVLERLGLVKGHDVTAAATVGTGPPSRQYVLTAKGQAYYLHVPVVITTARQHLTHPADFCVGTLTLDRLVGWEKPIDIGDRKATSVLFTYKITPAPWTQTPDALSAFPAVEHAVTNAGTLQLRLGVHLTPNGWVADELSD